MGTTSFDDIDNEAATKTDTPASTELATQPKGEVSTYAPGGQGPDPEDINIDHIQILGKSSHFDPEGGSLGDICINKEIPLVGEGEQLQCVLVHTRKYWKEDIPYGSDEMPQFANTPAEKDNLDANSDYKTIPVCDVTILLERPASFTDDEKAAAIFIYEFGGREFALVKYTVQKAQAVRENYGTINTVSHARRTKGGDATAYYFELSSKEKGTGTKFKWHQFVLRGVSAEAPVEAVEFARSLRGE